jgi:hypothetical protein
LDLTRLQKENFAVLRTEITLTPAGALALALDYDERAIASGPFDPAFEHLCRERTYWLNEAARLEKIEATK